MADATAVSTSSATPHSLQQGLNTLRDLVRERAVYEEETLSAFARGLAERDDMIHRHLKHLRGCLGGGATTGDPTLDKILLSENWLTADYPWPNKRS